MRGEEGGDDWVGRKSVAMLRIVFNLGQNLYLGFGYDRGWEKDRGVDKKSRRVKKYGFLHWNSIFFNKLAGGGGQGYSAVAVEDQLLKRRQRT